LETSSIIATDYPHKIISFEWKTFLSFCQTEGQLCCWRFSHGSYHRCFFLLWELWIFIFPLKLFTVSHENIIHRNEVIVETIPISHVLSRLELTIARVSSCPILLMSRRPRCEVDHCHHCFFLWLLPRLLLL